MTQHGFFIDLSRCIGCNSCTVSCKQWQDIAPGPAKPMRVYTWETDSFPNVSLHILPIMCFHCAEPVCRNACPNDAIRKEERYGAVLVDAARCQGSRKCWDACPYGTPQYPDDAPGQKMLKCDMCLDRLEEGLQPLCVLSCSMRALEFGPLDDIIRRYGNPRRLEARPGYGPCRLACPIEADAEGYVNLINEGDVPAALARFRATSFLAGVLGRVCTHPCESECQRGRVERPVAIATLKRFMADQDMAAATPPPSPLALRHPEKVAVIGSGPGGLSAAYDLVREGYGVTVFETSPLAGGMLRHAIPGYRLDKGVLDYEIGYLRQLGVEIITGTRIESVAAVFQRGYAAAVLASGASKGLRLSIPGEDLSGVTPALEFLAAVNSGQPVALPPRVAVIGGGGVAIDTARAARRSGAAEVYLVCLESGDLTCVERMPAEDEDVAAATREGVTVLDCRGVTAISAAADGALTLGTSVCLTVFDGGGKFAPQLDHTDMGSLTVDAVLVAIGQRATDGFPELPRRAGGTIEADAVTLATGLRGVFAAGDAVSGPTSVVLAVAAGKRAATSVQRYLRGLDLAAGRQAPPVAIALPDARHHSLAPPQLSVSQRDNFDEVSLGYDAATAAAQATRCWGCGTTLPAVVFKPRDAHIEVLPWDATRALQLWRERQPVAGETLPPVFEDIEEITAAQGDIVGRHRLVLKAKDSAELLYRTMDDE